jgi:hypothetical protein
MRFLAVVLALGLVACSDEPASKRICQFAAECGEFDEEDIPQCVALLDEMFADGPFLEQCADCVDGKSCAEADACDQACAGLPL